MLASEKSTIQLSHRNASNNPCRSLLSIFDCILLDYYVSKDIGSH